MIIAVDIAVNDIFFIPSFEIVGSTKYQCPIIIDENIEDNKTKIRISNKKGILLKKVFLTINAFESKKKLEMPKIKLSFFSKKYKYINKRVRPKNILKF